LQVQTLRFLLSGVTLAITGARAGTPGKRHVFARVRLIAWLGSPFLDLIAESFDLVFEVGAQSSVHILGRIKRVEERKSFRQLTDLISELIEGFTMQCVE
jgi:hypothetical protein